MVNHWVCYNTGKPFEANLEKFGFVYIITNTKTDKAYVGCKQYFLGKAKRKMKWETYMSSSKYLKADIKKIGKKHFTFEVIAEYKNKRSLNYYETYYQMKWNVLTATMEDSDEPAYYNSYVGGKFYRPIESYQDQTGEKNYNYKGKAEFYLDDKRMVVDCLGAWCNENGYGKGYISQIAMTTNDGFFNHITRGKQKALSLKGPLGTVTKVKWLRKEVKDVSQESNV